MASSSGDWSTPPADDYEALISTTDVELLKRAWRNEKAAPEILRYQEDLVKRAKEQIQLMEETVEEFAESGIDPLTVSLYQMDLDRAQFLLRSYLRVRLLKIEKYVFHILKSDETESLLSEQEKMFARRCADNMGEHLEDSDLLRLPDNYQSVLKQSIISEEDDMVPQPELETFVVCKSKNFLSLNLYEDGENPEMVEMDRGDLYFIRYKIIKRAVETGKIDLV
ncbi:LOW QUALITY PROTEIN: DNA replication complex GINS protein SLD5 [Carica papaya]|uniref:LOW QUALITY PROTEIN: DNA replication complex GINS protein SLD5 n=1 Tax=Carica papaya TaxID=3649 RepID=UPI000B8D1524|nr:LOW QUALITY PROTEIN: DNA replication complex GINS protein SLD5 [Carica papaya]